jgi:hypothetical protein
MIRRRAARPRCRCQHHHHRAIYLLAIFSSDGSRGHAIYARHTPLPTFVDDTIRTDVSATQSFMALRAGRLSERHDTLPRADACFIRAVTVMPRCYAKAAIRRHCLPRCAQPVRRHGVSIRSFHAVETCAAAARRLRRLPPVAARSLSRRSRDCDADVRRK